MGFLSNTLIPGYGVAKSLVKGGLDLYNKKKQAAISPVPDSLPNGLQLGPSMANAIGSNSTTPMVAPPKPKAPAPVVKPQVAEVKPGSPAGPTTANLPTPPVVPPLDVVKPPAQQPEVQHEVKAAIEQPKSDEEATRFRELQKRYFDSLALSPEEQEISNKLANLEGSEAMGLAEIENKVIPMRFITGQQANVRNQALAQAVPLRKRLELEQAKRELATRRLGAEYDYESGLAKERKDKLAEQEKPVTLSEGQQIVKYNPATKRYETVSSGGKKSSSPVSVSEGSTLVDPATGNVIYRSPKTPSEKPLTVEQSKARQFAASADQANKILDTSSYNLGIAEPWLPNVLKSTDRQQFEQAARAFVNSVLRRESGATITDSEFLNKHKELIPQAGDGAAVLEQKRLARETAVNSIKEAGQTPIDDVLELNGVKFVPDGQGGYVPQGFKQVGADTNIGTFNSRLSRVNNNPGNLRFAGQPGASQGEGGFARFSTPQAGIAALKQQIKLDATRGHTVQSFINKYAPPSENDTNQYVNQAVVALGVLPSTPLAQLDLNQVARFIAKKESGSIIA